MSRQIVLQLCKIYFLQIFAIILPFLVLVTIVYKVQREYHFTYDTPSELYTLMSRIQHISELLLTGSKPKCTNFSITFWPAGLTASFVNKAFLHWDTAFPIN